MNQVTKVTDPIEQNGVARRSLLTQIGVGAATAMAVGAVATGASIGTSVPAEAQTVSDTDILNFALNLEYIEAQYYSRAFFGTGLQSADMTGIGTPGFTLGGSAVPFQTPQVASLAEKLTIDEVNHVRFLRRALGSAAVAQPNIDLLNSFNALAAAAGLVAKGTQFNPFLNETNFLLGAFIFEDVGVTAYNGAAGLISSKAYLGAAASILAIEAYHGGAIRTALGYLGQQSAANAISALRGQLGGGNEQGVATTNPTVSINISPSNSDSLAFARTTTQVLNIVYGGVITGGGFLPNQMNGLIR